MSLINDALKRAQAEKRREAQSGAPVPPLEPAMAAPSGSSKMLPWAAFGAGVVALAVAAVLWFNSRPEAARQIARAPTAEPGALSTKQAGTSPETAPTVVAASQSAPVESTSPNVPSAAVPPATAPVQPAPAQSGANTAIIPQPSETRLATATTPARPEPAPVPQAAPQPETKVAAVTPSSVAPAASPVTQATVPVTLEPEPSRPPDLQAIYYRLRGPTVVINGKTLRAGQTVDGAKVVSIQRTSVEVLYGGEYRTLTLKD